MKTKKYILSMLLALGVAISTMAQDHLFTVLVSKGSNKVVSGVKTENLYVGKKISKNEKVILAANSYLGLAHKNGKTIEIRKPGTYDATTLIGQVSAQNASSSTKYANYVASEMTKSSDKAATAKSKYANARVLGSVERGDSSATLNAPRVGGQAFLETLHLTWHTPENIKKATKTYVIKVQNFYDEVLFTDQTTNSFYDLDLSKIKSLNGQKDSKIKISVDSKEAPVKSLEHLYDVSVKVLSSEAHKGIQEELNEMKFNLSENNSLNHLLLGSFYENHKMYFNALDQYKQAADLNADIDEFKVPYVDLVEKITKEVQDYEKNLISKE